MSRRKPDPGEYKRLIPAGGHADDPPLPARVVVGADLIKRLLEYENAARWLAREFRSIREQIAKGAT